MKKLEKIGIGCIPCRLKLEKLRHDRLVEQGWIKERNLHSKRTKG